MAVGGLSAYGEPPETFNLGRREAVAATLSKLEGVWEVVPQQFL